VFRGAAPAEAAGGLRVHLRGFVGRFACAWFKLELLQYVVVSLESVEQAKPSPSHYSQRYTCSPAACNSDGTSEEGSYRCTSTLV
jgi:hypothetical protein